MSNSSVASTPRTKIRHLLSDRIDETKSALPKPPPLVGYFTLLIDHIIVDSAILRPIYKLLNEQYGQRWNLELMVTCDGKDYKLQTQHKTFNAMLAHYTFNRKKNNDAASERSASTYKSHNSSIVDGSNLEMNKSIHSLSQVQ